MENHLHLTANRAARAVSAALDALLYEDGELKNLTQRAVALVEIAIATEHPDALILRGIQTFRMGKKPYEYMCMAEERGSTHPLLYHFLGDCWSWEGRGMDIDRVKAQDYYVKALGGTYLMGKTILSLLTTPLAYFFLFLTNSLSRFPTSLGCPIVGGCSLSFLGLYCNIADNEGDDVDSYTRGLEEAFQYLLQCEADGLSDPAIFYRIAQCYLYGHGTSMDCSKARDYFELGAAKGSAQGYLGLKEMAINHSVEYPDYDLAVKILLAAEEQGVKDERILEAVIGILCTPDYSPSPEVLGQFQCANVMALYYSEVLIQRKSYLGYQRKGMILWHQMNDEARGLSVFLDADRHGYATAYTYYHYLAHAYLYVHLPVMDILLYASVYTVIYNLLKPLALIYLPALLWRTHINLISVYSLLHFP